MSDCNVNVEQKTATCERANISIFQILSYIVRSNNKKSIFKFNSKQKIQFLLASLVFFTFGIGDGFTGAYMMNVCGILSEANPFARHIVETQGWIGLIIFKLWITLTLLSIVLSIEKISNNPMYWMTNGFLVALGLGGIMATIANLMRIYDFVIFGYGVPSPLLVVLVYTGLMFVLVSFGSLIDNRKHSKFPYVHGQYL
ncbi:MAG TPA: hypothetical protein C5S51_07710 [Methanosarcinaceae archaeon]|nr:hypothetical protein [Methanosarcinaceae archaeon]